MYVVAGVTGNTGSVVAEALLSRGEKVRVLVREASKGEAWKRRGAEVAVASVENAEELAEAIRGAKGVYALIPPDVTHEDPLGRGARIADAWTTAIAKSNVAHVVFLSSVGAQHAQGTGPIRMLHDAEQKLRAQKVPVTFLRPSFFLENWASGLGPAASDGVLPTFERETTRFAMIATRDIGEIAAKSLLEPSTAHRTIEIAGPADLTPNEVAAKVGALLGRDVKALYVPNDQVVPTLTGFGISRATAELFREMAIGIDSGLVDYERKGAARGSVPAEVVFGKLIQK